MSSSHVDGDVAIARYGGVRHAGCPRERLAIARRSAGIAPGRASREAGIDDLRESPALDITQALAESGCGEILVVERDCSRPVHGS
jgi:hypothetical protein